MAATTDTRARAGRREAVDAALLVVGVAQLVPGALALLAPGAFYDLIGPYPPENPHFVKDLGSWQIALGAAALYAVRRPAWRAPMLAVLALQYALHAVSHLIDVDASDPAWNGPVVLATQALGAAVLAALFVRERKR
jgi:threonine dehydrogenase-like Zn-dependent dehydrogenase